jgi:hypothetical protein
MDTHTAVGARAVTLRPLANSSVLAVAAVYGVLLWLAERAGLFGIVLLMFVSLSLWRYSYAVLRIIAQGRTFIPAPDVETMNPVGEIRLVLHFCFFGLLLYFFQTTPLFGDALFADVLRWAGVGVVLAVFPASAALMSFTMNPAAALNPMSIAGVIRTMGKGYGKLMLAVAALAAFTELIPAVFGRGFVAMSVRDVASVWGLLATFALIGGAVREHRADFDIPGGREDDDERLRRERELTWQKTLDRAYASIRSRLSAEGHATINELLAAENDSLAAHQWVFYRMLEWEDRTHALQFADRLLERLIAGGSEHGALELVAQCRRLWRDYTVPAASAARLAAYARAIGRHGVADELAAFSLRAPLP